MENLIDGFASLPGIGRKSAQRLAFHVLSLPQEEADRFANAVLEAKKSVHTCPVCQNLTDGERAPWSTWYTPWYSRLRSMLSTSRGSDTTQIVVLSRLSDAHTGQSSPSVRFWHTGQVWTLFFASSTALAKRSASSCGSEST